MVINCRELVIPFVRWGSPADVRQRPNIWKQVMQCKGLSRLSVEDFGVFRNRLEDATPEIPQYQKLDLQFVAGRRFTVGLADNSFETTPTQQLLFELASTAEFLSVRFIRPYSITDPMEAVTCVANMIHSQVSLLHCELPIIQTVGTGCPWWASH